MSLTVGSNFNNYSSLFSTTNNGKSQKKTTSNQLDFMSMGTIRNAVIQQKAKEQMNSRFEKTNNNDPTYTDKFSWYGIDITDNPNAHKEIVPISDEVKEKIFENVKRDFEQTGRVNKEDVSIMESFYDLKDNYVKNINGMDKLKTSWTMSQYRFELHDKIEEQIRKLDKKWDWGQPVKNEVLNQIFGSKFEISI